MLETPFSCGYFLILFWNWQEKTVTPMVRTRMCAYVHVRVYVCVILFYGAMCYVHFHNVCSIPSLKHNYNWSFYKGY